MMPACGSIIVENISHVWMGGCSSTYLLQPLASWLIHALCMPSLLDSVLSFYLADACHSGWGDMWLIYARSFMPSLVSVRMLCVILLTLTRLR